MRIGVLETWIGQREALTSFENGQVLSLMKENLCTDILKIHRKSESSILKLSRRKRKLMLALYTIKHKIYLFIKYKLEKASFHIYIHIHIYSIHWDQC